MTRVIRGAYVVVVAISVAAAQAGGAAAQGVPRGTDSTQIGTPTTTGDSALEARTTAVASQLRCPVCQGLSIQDSPSDLSQQMRSLVRDQLAAGKTPDEVKAYFVSKYGEWILLSPKASGFNLFAYGLPVLTVLLGGAGIFVAVRRWTSPPDEPLDGPLDGPPASTPDAQADATTVVVKH